MPVAGELRHQPLPLVIWPAVIGVPLTHHVWLGADHLPPSHFSSLTLPPTLVMQSPLWMSWCDTCSHWSARSCSHWKAWMCVPAFMLPVSSAQTVEPAPLVLFGYCAQIAPGTPLSPLTLTPKPRIRWPSSDTLASDLARRSF